MPTSTNVTNLKINELTEAQYDAAVLAGTIGPNEISIITDAEAGQVIQIDTMPTASAEEVDKIYQFIGTTDANYTNGYFYKCVSDGQNPATYSWTRVDVQPTPSGLPDQTGNSGKFLTTDGTDASWSDKPLVNKSSGTNSLCILGSENDKYNSVVIGKNSRDLQGSNTVLGIGSMGNRFSSNNIIIGNETYTQNNCSNNILIGNKISNASTAGGGAVMFNTSNSMGYAPISPEFVFKNTNGQFTILSSNGTIPADRLVYSIGKYSSMPTAAAAKDGWIVQFTGTTSASYTHGYIYECGAVASSATASQTTGSSLSDVSVVVATFETQITTTGSYVFSYDGTNWSYNSNTVTIGDYGITFTGTPVSGDEITVDYTASGYGWSQINVQPAPVIPDPLPSQTGNSGKFLTTDGTDASWATVDALPSQTGNADKLLITDGTNVSWSGYAKITGVTSANRQVFFGGFANTPGSNLIIIGGGSTKCSNTVVVGGNGGGYGANTSGASVFGFDASANAGANYSVALGTKARTGATNAIQINASDSYITNSDANTMKIANANGNFEMMSADGTIPEARLADTTNATQGQVLTLDANNNAVWQTPSTAVTTASATLAVADWSSNTQTITVNGVTSSNVVIVSPQPLSATDYAAAGILCTGQAANSLTFTCTATPSTAISLSIVIIG